ncbi:glycosyltransferase family 2 protein [Mycolicibacterium sp.]|uniref:glycosyltransferase family 2 protein n=1 Tax=Mycolicibacterium sp. TaxID=2320850 RepID=UPI003D152926
MAATAMVTCLVRGRQATTMGTWDWWLITGVLHIPYLVVALFLMLGLIERVGYLWRGRPPSPPGQLRDVYPTVAVQLPMFNEHAVAERIITAACAMTWPKARLTIQVLDDSTDPDTRTLVDGVCERMRRERGVDVRVLRREDRQGYKAGALEAARRATDAEFIVIFDADFVPTEDFLVRAMPHFFTADGTPDTELVLVQTQWGHLNPAQSRLTAAQSLWVDDHHTLQMSWRSAMWRFVNFTGTAGVWRASAIEAVGGWRATSLVEDCELSFRQLFAGRRTAFVKEIVVPAELPATYTAYKAQQRRWTRGWMQLQRLHLLTLLVRYRCGPIRRIALLYHMCIPWQWAAWAVWALVLPLLIYTGHWLGALGPLVGAVFYLLPAALFAIAITTLATVEARHTYPGPRSVGVLASRMRRLIPFLILNTGMIAHQFSAVVEGLFGEMHGEFERTPKAAATDGGRAATTAKRYRVKIHWTYVLAEGFFVIYQIAAALLLLSAGFGWAAAGAVYLAGCVLFVALYYGDDAGKRIFVVDRAALSRLVGAR